MSKETDVTIEDLYLVRDKAEIVDGELVLLGPAGDLPSTAAFEIAVSLRAFARRTKLGRAYTDNAAFVVDLPNRKSFSPDAAFYIGPRSIGKFLQGAPLFAVEVRNEDDYGLNAETKIARKRSDYFAAATQVVWDVDVLRDRVIRSYLAVNPNAVKVFHCGDLADAGPVLPGWSMSVDDLFE
jgi:Uma2 family endonuclease